MTRRSSRALLIVLTVVFLSACGGGSKPAEPNWLVEDAPYTNTLAVLDDGTQLAIAIPNVQLRNSTGQILPEPMLPQGTPQYAIAQRDQFILYGRNDNDIWRVTLNASGEITSDTVLYSGSNIIGLFRLKLSGNDIVIHWNDDGQVGWYSETLGQSGLSPAADATLRYTFSPSQHLFYVDNSSTELVEVALSSGLEISRTPVDSAFLGAGSLYVNDGFAVATVVTELHDGVDLVVQNRNTLEIHNYRSLGGFGTFDLRPIGQDGSGNIYYYYYAAYAHSGFGAGPHIRAISESEPKAWEYDLAGGNLWNNRLSTKTQESGLQILYVDSTSPITPDFIEHRYTSYYVALDSTGTELTSFYLQPHRTQYITMGLALGQTITLETGYLGRAFDTDASGLVYIYGQVGITTPLVNFAGQY